ncbi:MAG: hypothetical protein IJE16_06690 [Ruminococcus sp.]|nr:hypothetical protein [Ruminococcus sp.]
MENKEKSESKVNKKALWWSLLWSNVAMGLVLLLTFLFLRYIYQSLLTVTIVDIAINPLVIVLGYVVGMLLLWLIIYKYETKEDTYPGGSENHNIY